MKRMGVILFIAIALFSSCKADRQKIVIASKPMTEQYIITEMLIKLIEKDHDVEIEYIQGVGGGTSNIHPGMIKGEIDIYPEYTGTGWMFVLKQDLINDPAALYKEVKEFYRDEFGIVWSGLYGFNDTYGIGIKSDIAKQLNLETYSDLAKVSDQLILGAEYDFYEREDGYPGLEAVYGFNFKEKAELDIGLKYQAVGASKVDLINIFSTDGRLKEYNLKVLEDDKNFFPSYFCATLVREDTLSRIPGLDKTLEKMTGIISNDEMTEMNYMVEIEKKDPVKVAEDFLISKGLL